MPIPHEAPHSSLAAPQIVTFFTDVVVVELPPPPRGMPRPGPNLLLLPPASLDPALGSSPGLMQVGSLGGGTAGTAGTNCQATPSEIMTGTALDVVFESGAQAQGSQSSALHGERASACSITAALAPTSAFSAAATQPSAGGTSYGYGYGSQRGSGGGGGAGSNAGSTAFGTGAAGSPQGYGHGLNAYGFVANGGGLSLGALVAAAAAGIPTEALVPPAGLTDARGSGISSLAQQEHYRALVICMEYCDGGSLSDAVAGGAFKQRIKGGYGASVPDMLACYLTLLEVRGRGRACTSPPICLCPCSSWHLFLCCIAHASAPPVGCAKARRPATMFRAPNFKEALGPPSMTRRSPAPCAICTPFTSCTATSRQATSSSGPTPGTPEVRPACCLGVHLCLHRLN